MAEVMSIEVDEDFDPRPHQAPFSLRDPEGNPNWPIIGGIALAIVLVIAIIIVLVKPFGSSEEVAAPPEWRPKDPTVAVNFLETYPTNDPIVSSVQSALDAMAKFYTDGEMDILDRYFDRAGQQYAVLLKERPKIEAEPDLEGPAEVRLGPIGKVRQVDNTHVVRTQVTWTIPGKEPNVFDWDITLLQEDARYYLLSSIAESDPLGAKPINFCDAAELVSELDTYDEVSEQMVKFPSSEQLDLVLDSYEIRLKTWTYMQRAARNTGDSDHVDVIIAEFNRIIGQREVAESLEAVFAGQDKATFERSYGAITARVASQCENEGIDITNR